MSAPLVAEQVLSWDALEAWLSSDSAPKLFSRNHCTTCVLGTFLGVPVGWHTYGEPEKPLPKWADKYVEKVTMHRTRKDEKITRGNALKLLRECQP